MGTEMRCRILVNKATGLRCRRRAVDGFVCVQHLSQSALTRSEWLKLTAASWDQAQAKSRKRK
jgi:hypothetical protein